MNGLAQAHAARLSAPVEQRLGLHGRVHTTELPLPVDAVVNAPSVALLPSVAHDLHQANHAQQEDQDANRVGTPPLLNMGFLLFLTIMIIIIMIVIMMIIMIVILHLQ